jgi:hypothetical protein
MRQSVLAPILQPVALQQSSPELSQRVALFTKEAGIYKH